MKRAGIYLRVSTEDQAGKYGLDLQMSACEKFAGENNYRVVKTYLDPGVSGQDADRPGINDALTDAGKGLFDVLLIYDYTRLGRRQAVSVGLREAFEEADVEVVTAFMGELPEEARTYIEPIMDALSQAEVVRLSARTKAGRRRSAESGNIVTTKRILGYDLVKEDGKTKFEINDDEARAVRRMFRMFNEGMSLNDIAKKLNDEGVAKPTGTKPWQPQNLREAFRNSAYMGEWRYGKQRTIRKGSKKIRIKTSPEDQVVVPCPAIIDNETWARAQIRIQENIRRASRNVKHNYLLRGRVFCQDCGHRYYNRTTNKTWGYYVHDDYSNRKHDCGNEHNPPVQVMDEAVKDFLIEVVTDPDFATKERERYEQEKERYQSQDQVELEQLKKKLDELRKQVLRIDEAYTKAEFSLEQYSTQAERIAQEEETLMKRSEEIRSKLTPRQRAWDSELDGPRDYFEHLEGMGMEMEEDEFYEMVREMIDFDELVERLDCTAYVSGSGKIALHSMIRDEKPIVSWDGAGWKRIV